MPKSTQMDLEGSSVNSEVIEVCLVFLPARVGPDQEVMVIIVVVGMSEFVCDDVIDQVGRDEPQEWVQGDGARLQIRFPSLPLLL